LTSTDKGVRPPNAPISDAGADVDAAGNAADAGGGEVADSKMHQEPIAVASRLAGRRYELGA